MSGTVSRSLLLMAALGLLGACDLVEPPQEAAPVVKAPVAAAPAPAVAPVKKKKAPVVIDFDDGGSGGGGWG